MLTVFSNDQLLHEGKSEFHRGQLLPCFESPKRAELILAELQANKSGDIIAPDRFGLEPVLRIHDAAYVEFLQTAFDRWHTIHPDCDALPHTWNMRGARDILPNNIYGQLGYYSCDASTPIMAHTWQAAKASADAAIMAQRLVMQGHRSAFALTRPPGHHATSNVYGGYCYLNNAAIAAQAFLDGDAKQVAILDIDYHHGNGTQIIFEDRNDVLVVSIHANPAEAYPYFLGYADETGTGAGKGYNLNLPLPDGTDWNSYQGALETALAAISRFTPDYLVVSLGVDTYAGDPISSFKLSSNDFSKLGHHLGKADFPTLILMEGGYAVDNIGCNVVKVLTGFEDAI
ncbi:histone deacetylase family protein [Gimesia fumaroli]|uniref:Acetylpolyamine aminohydrolase n=1 Tax=Gimesia fumaroli TaxID=2527976 RepID=A0A518IEL3_9PLAN|nr:histone deacetylase family protein [Gimesia fumaroli]QDV51542.1 Acetylpolyamine aminohydrolase [Gimesia fumaroli]